MSITSIVVEIDILEADTASDCSDHPEIGTLRRSHCTDDRLYFASDLVISIVFDPVYVDTLRLIPDVITSSVPRDVAVEGCSFPIHTHFICSTRLACRYKRWYVPN